MKSMRDGFSSSMIVLEQVSLCEVVFKRGMCNTIAQNFQKALKSWSPSSWS